MRMSSAYWLPLLLYLGFIFFISSQLTTLGSEPIFLYADKIYHFVEFFFLGLFLARELFWFEKMIKPGFAWVRLAILCLILLGVADEWHQSFTPGREQDFLDMLTDALGGMTGILFFRYFLQVKIFAAHPLQQIELQDRKFFSLVAYFAVCFVMVTVGFLDFKATLATQSKNHVLIWEVSQVLVLSYVTFRMISLMIWQSKIRSVFLKLAWSVLGGGVALCLPVFLLNFLNHFDLQLEVFGIVVCLLAGFLFSYLRNFHHAMALRIEKNPAVSREGLQRLWQILPFLWWATFYAIMTFLQIMPLQGLVTFVLLTLATLHGLKFIWWEMWWHPPVQRKKIFMILMPLLVAPVILAHLARGQGTPFAFSDDSHFLQEILWVLIAPLLYHLGLVRARLLIHPSARPFYTRQGNEAHRHCG